MGKCIEMILLLYFPVSMNAHSVMPPRSYIVSNNDFYFKMVPGISSDKNPGTKPFGYVFSLLPDGTENKLWSTSGWYSDRTYINSTADYLVSIDTYEIGSEPLKSHDAISFYKKNQFIKSHSLISIVKDNSKFITTYPNSDLRTYFKKINGITRIQNIEQFVVRMTDDATYFFDLETGDRFEKPISQNNPDDLPDEEDLITELNHRIDSIKIINRPNINRISTGIRSRDLDQLIVFESKQSGNAKKINPDNSFEAKLIVSLAEIKKGGKQLNIPINFTIVELVDKADKTSSASILFVEFPKNPELSYLRLLVKETDKPHFREYYCDPNGTVSESTSAFGFSIIESAIRKLSENPEFKKLNIHSRQSTSISAYKLLYKLYFSDSPTEFHKELFSTSSVIALRNLDFEFHLGKTNDFLKSYNP